MKDSSGESFFCCSLFLLCVASLVVVDLPTTRMCVSVQSGASSGTKDRQDYKAAKMRVVDMLQMFQRMPTSDRIHLLCQMLRLCLPQELHFILTVLLGFKEENSEKWSKQESAVNQLSYLSGLQDGGILAGKNIAMLCYVTMLLRPSNREVAQEVYKILDDKDLMVSAQNCDDLKLLNQLRLLYVLAVYHPALPSCYKLQMLATLEQLDSLYEQKEVGLCNAVFFLAFFTLF